MKSGQIVAPWKRSVGNNRPAEIHLLEEDYDSYWMAEENGKRPEIIFQFAQPVTFNRVLLQEYIPLGQRVAKFHVEAKLVDGKWHTIAQETTIGYKRIVLTETVTAMQVRVVMDETRASPVLNRVGLFMDNIMEEL